MLIPVKFLKDHLKSKIPRVDILWGLYAGLKKNAIVNTEFKSFLWSLG